MEARMRSNDSIAQLACALAKAQIELVNPLKSLTAHLDGDGNGSPGQSYRYAPLSASGPPPPPTPAAMACSRWSDSPVRMTSMPLSTCVASPRQMGAPPGL